MNKVLLTHSYFYPLDHKQWRFKQPYPPLGTLQAAAVIRQAGFEVSFVDVGLTNGPDIIVPSLETHPDFFVIYDDGFNYLTKMCLIVMREAAFKMAAAAKKSGAIVIINSSDASDHYEKYFANGVDYVIRGEGEVTLKILLETLKKNEEPTSVSGIAYRKNSTIMNPPRAVLRNLDELPPPAWDLIDLEPYRDIWINHHGYFSLNIATTRGCPFKCNWCAKPIYGNHYNSRSVEKVVDEIGFLIANYHPDHFWMCDDIFGLKPGWVKQFAESVHQKNLSFEYKIQSRVDLLLDDGIINSLVSSGCKTVWVGAESGSQKILDAMDKGIKIAQIREATENLKQHKINVAYFLQFGYPGENWDDIMATLQMVLQLMPDELGISVSYPLPGTPFYEAVKNDLTQKQNWVDSDDLALMFSNQYPSGFYKILHRYVHSRYRIQKGLNKIKELIRHPDFSSGDFRKIASMVYHIPLSFYQSYQLRKMSS